jgi:hypothetical protein
MFGLPKFDIKVMKIANKMGEIPQDDSAVPIPNVKVDHSARLHPHRPE